MTPDPRELFRGRIAAHLGLKADQVSLFAKGRVALYAILRALDVGPGDEVILPAFTCVAVPNAILYAGARPIYVDIDAASFTIDPTATANAIGPRTRVILAQNTFGLAADLDSLEAIAAGRGATVVDDCTHGLGGHVGGRPTGSTAPASFFSTQWSKPLSTGLGGFAVALDDSLAARVRDLEETAREPPAARVALLRVLVRGRDRAGNGRLLRAGRAAYRLLSRAGMVPASSNRDELEGVAMPAGFLTRLSAWQASLGAARLDRVVPDLEARRSIARRYSAWLADNGRIGALERPGSIHTFLRYPIRVHDRPAFEAAAAKARVDLGDWFVSPIHPVTAGWARWGYEAGTAPTAEAACAEIVNLPVAATMSPAEVDRVIRFLDATSDLIR